MFSIEIAPRERTKLLRLPEKLAAKLSTIIDGLATVPLPVGTKKLVGSGGRYRLRVGDYRVVYSVDFSAKRIRIERIRHRREVYREL